MTASEYLARRFLHVNLNCESLRATEALYAAQLGLTPAMRSDASLPRDGAMLGIDGETYSATTFFYDTRGGRKACALEAVEWQSPALDRDLNTDPVRPGIRSALFTVNDLGAVAARLRAVGRRVSDPVTGLISGRPALLLTDEDGVLIELAEVPSDLPGALFGGIRIMAIDVQATVDFLSALGFEVLEPATTALVRGEQLGASCSREATPCIAARLALPEDRSAFTVTVLQHPETSGYPLPGAGNSQGLYRCAMRVESIDEAIAHLPNEIESQGEPVWCPMPGTKIEGLYVAFFLSPDGVVFEFVQRPLKHFKR